MGIGRINKNRNFMAGDSNFLQSKILSHCDAHKTKVIKLEEESLSLPGLENIRKRQAGQGLKKPAKPSTLKTKPGVGLELPGFKKESKPKAQTLDLRQDDARPSLPGLDALRKQQLEQAK